MTSTLPPLTQAVAGGLGSFTANATLFPLDVVITRMQTHKSNIGASKQVEKRSWYQVLQDIVQEDGWSGLYSGFLSDSLATLTSNFLYFYAYSQLRSRLLDTHTRHARRLQAIPPEAHPYPSRAPPPIALSSGEELAAGFIAGVASRLVSTPLSVVTVRAQARQAADLDAVGHKRQRARGVLSALKAIYAEEGILGLWKGFESTIILCSNPAITLFLFQLYRRFVLRNRSPTPGQAFIGGAVSNAIAVAMLYPAIIVKVIAQNSRKILSISTALNNIIKKRGIAGLYDGLQPQLIKGFFKEGLTLMTKAQIEAVVVALYLMSRRKEMA